VTQGTGPRFERRVADWLGVREAQKRILGAVGPGRHERVSLAEALGRALAEDVVSPATLPPWDNSAMDGYAVLGDDIAEASGTTPVRLVVKGRTRAGDDAQGTVARGEAVRIMTGAPVPPGCDSVVRVEDTDAEFEPGFVNVLDNRDRGRHIRPMGEDMKEGDRVAVRGASVNAGLVAVLAAVGRSDVMVHARPTVAILATGSELRPPDRFHEVRAGRGVPESNGAMLSAAARTAGAVPSSLGIVEDDPEALRQAVLGGADADALVTIGGASMGEADLVKGVLEEMGFQQDFWRVRMRPGSPFGFGWLPRDQAPQAVFSLPGNPASAFVTFELFVRPFLLRLAGHSTLRRRRVMCAAGQRLRGAPGLTMFTRVEVRSGEGLVAVPVAPQGSGLVRGLASAQGLAVVPEGMEAIEEGAAVDVLLLDGVPDPMDAGIRES
jgi:molybdopterin molybdotransferase